MPIWLRRRESRLGAGRRTVVVRTRTCRKHRTIEVENTLYQHPAVLEVAVIGIPHDKWGEVPKAFVTLQPGQTASERDLIDFARERLAHFKCPKAVEFGEIPKTATGKMQKFKLREREWAGRSSRIQG